MIMLRPDAAAQAVLAAKRCGLNHSIVEVVG